MPKQIKFSKSDITKAVLEVIRESGSGAVTARSICKKTGSSVTPLFREYATMEDVLEDAMREAEKVFSDYMADVCHYNPAFKMFGIKLVNFAKLEPNLFRFLFFERSGMSTVADSLAHECLKLTGLSFKLNEDQTEFLFEQLWPFACGLAQLCCNNPEVYTEEKISRMLSAQFQSLLMHIKSACEVQDIIPTPISQKK